MSPDSLVVWNVTRAGDKLRASSTWCSSSDGAVVPLLVHVWEELLCLPQGCAINLKLNWHRVIFLWPEQYIISRQELHGSFWRVQSCHCFFQCKQPSCTFFLFPSVQWLWWVGWLLQSLDWRSKAGEPCVHGKKKINKNRMTLNMYFCLYSWKMEPKEVLQIAKVL